MTMANYRVEYADGREVFLQFDDQTDAGKEGLEALREVAKRDDSPIKSVQKGEPKA
jgi:hypothetical protein